MRVAFLQFAPTFGDKNGNFQRVAELLPEGIKLDLLVLPELFQTGYLFENKSELNSLAEEYPAGPTLTFLKRITAQVDGAVFAGFAERSEGQFYNSAMLVLPTGESFLYRKLHLFDREKCLFTPGNLKSFMVPFRGAKLAPAICFDWFFPEYFRSLALMGATVICHSANLVMPWYKKAAPVRALENHVYIVTSDRRGSEHRAGISLNFVGGSIVVSPKGEVLCDVDGDAEGVFFVDIVPELAGDKRLNSNNDIFLDRRANFYELLGRS